MKKGLLLFLLINSMMAVSQETVGGKIVQKSKDKVTNRTEQKTDEVIDNTINKIEEGISNIFKKKEKKEKKEVQTQTENKNVNQTLVAYDPQITKTDQLGNTDYSSYKNFDFIPGQDLLFLEDFTDNSKQRWGAYDTEQMQIIANDGKNWLEVKSGSFYPLQQKILPRNFTLEFDVYTPDTLTGTLAIRFLDQSQANSLADPWLDNSSSVHLSPITQTPKTGLGGYDKKINNEELNPQNQFQFYTWQPELGNYYARISLKRENNKLSLWVNKEKVMDNVDVFVPNREHLLAFHMQNYFVEENRMYVTNFKLATGKATIKNDIVTKNTFVTNHIYFDTNKDVIRPNSYATLLQIATTMKEMQGNFTIIGHTDADGNDTQNLLLSLKRAEAVKRALTNEFGIDANRLSTDGKGETQPLNQNTTPVEKAQNRRVEFVKQ